MFIPINDDNPLRHLPFQYVTVGLIALNVAVFVLTHAAARAGIEASAVSFGMIPSVVHAHETLPAGYAVVPVWMTLITYQFLHADFLHLAANMAFLWVFGDNVEDATGHLRFLVFYLLCGVFAGLLHAQIDPRSTIPLVGASGSVAGIIAAYLMLHPRVKVWVLVLWRVPLRLKAMWVLGFWVALQFFMLAADEDGSVAWLAHIGGLAAGAVLIVFMRRRGVPLFDRGLVIAETPGR